MLVVLVSLSVLRCTPDRLGGDIQSDGGDGTSQGESPASAGAGGADEPSGREAAGAGGIIAAAGSGGAPSNPSGGAGTTPGGAGSGGGQAGAANDCREELEFEQTAIDDEFFGELKALGDLSGDGLLDIAVGGTELRWYEAPHWTVHSAATADEAFVGHMQAGDVNGDGAVDLVLPDGDLIYWFENPAGSGSSPAGEWTRHLIGDQEFRAHELELADMNGDGKLDVVTNTNLRLWLQGSAPTKWQKIELHALADGEGLDVGDIDGDERPDLAVRGYWIRTPADPTKPEDYDRYPIDVSLKGTVVVDIADVDGDGSADVAYSPKEDGFGDIRWYTATSPADQWTKHTVGPASFAHGFTVADFNGDGRNDFFFAQMDPAPTRTVGVFLNQPDGTFELEVLAETGSHNIVLGDIGNDCDPDIVGANWQAPPVHIFENKRCDGSDGMCN